MSWCIQDKGCSIKIFDLVGEVHSEVTDSTVAPFLDKLMLYHITTLISAAAAYFGEALSVSQRRDLAADYALMISKISLLAEDGTATFTPRPRKIGEE